MTTYRAYQLDNRHRILTGTWIQAKDDQDAHDQAAELCDDGVEAIELWQAETKVGEIDCPPDEAPPRRAKSSR